MYVLKNAVRLLDTYSRVREKNINHVEDEEGHDKLSLKRFCFRAKEVQLHAGLLGLIQITYQFFMVP